MTMAQNGRQSARHLLLLPPPPSPPSFVTLNAAYGATLCLVLRQLQHSSASATGAALLEIALPCPHLHASGRVPRAALFARTQSLVAGLYKLICVIAARERIDVESADGVDARILLLAYPRNGALSHLPAEGRAEADLQGPVIDIGTLAQSGRSWDTVYAVEGEAGEQLLKDFQACGKHMHNIKKARGGIVQVSDGDANEPTLDQVRRHVSVAVGGTFDHLHIGHKLLLTMTAFAVEPASSVEGSERGITVGITGDELLKNKKYAEYLESWDARQRRTAEFLRCIIDFAPPGGGMQKVEEVNNPGPNGHAINITLPTNLVLKCVEIWDPYGPTITDESISALILSGETRSGGRAVNAKRQEKSWPELEVFEVDVLDAQEERDAQGAGVEQSFQSKLSSTEIRRVQSERSRPTGNA
ncbi:pantetheine-phosphate adenylyltransferase family protein [Diplodia corticola]|uniref:Pantetheine-phosphate adenylyltransferase family protein n=1 Tax=Diplodia corticola TaxID=236234 RepID=A0A1J9QZA8_9PEZI|nr:pantetheine-phosphate adenylyltransferase family protein [Diplodia corticola]OJD33713.1 pantetheine-phosphate adenylyltransferase family protein [Diplodia corticola]